MFSSHGKGIGLDDQQKVGFGAFLDAWNARQGMDTPELHKRIAQWLEERWGEGETRILLMAFRAAGKSTIVGVFAAWLLYRRPDLRILVLAAEGALARKMVRNVKRIIERHPYTQGMKPKRTDQWAADYFTVERGPETRDPSMLARGVMSNFTGSRADVVICDDVEVPNTCGTVEKREELRNRLREMAYVLVAGGSQIYVGTPHTYYSVYADVPRKEIGEDQPFLMDFKRMSVPIVDEAGKSAWPERYSEDAIERMKRETGPNKFQSQMMLQTINILDSRLDVELLQYYNCDFEVCPVKGKYHLGHQELRRMIGFWDPSTASSKGDESVVAIVYMDIGGNYYVHHLSYIRIDRKSAEDEMTQQCRIAAQAAQDFHVTQMKVEDNGLGKYFPAALGRMMKEISCHRARAIAVSNRRNKDQRIIEAFDAPLAAGRLFVHERIKDTPFIREMREWKPGGKSRDDGLDAVAGALEELSSGGLKGGLQATQWKAKTVLDN